MTMGMSIYPDLPGFHAEPKRLVYAMIEAGWRGRLTSKGHWLGKAPDGHTTATVQAKVGDMRGLRNAKAAFARWLKANLTPEETVAIEAAFSAADDDDEIVAQTILGGIARKQVTRLNAEAQKKDLEKELEKMVKVTTAEPPARKQVKARAWLARKVSNPKGGVRYESEAVIERTWSDGTIDYACAMGGCTYVNDKPRSVANHFGAKHTKHEGNAPVGEGPQHPDPEYTEPLSHRDYRPTQRLVLALAAVLAAMNGHGTDQEKAIAILTWMNDRPDIDHTERPLVPLTDKQVLDRIRMLIGMPDPDQTAKIAELETARVNLELENRELRKQIAHLKSEKSALRDLLTEDDDE